MAISMVAAIVVVSLVAYLPGWLVAFLAVSLLLDRQPPLRRTHPAARSPCWSPPATLSIRGIVISRA